MAELPGDLLEDAPTQPEPEAAIAEQSGSRVARPRPLERAAAEVFARVVASTSLSASEFLRLQAAVASSPHGASITEAEVAHLLEVLFPDAALSRRSEAAND